MSRYYQMFKTKEERTKWEKEQKKKEKFKICFRCTAEQLKKDLPFVDIGDFKYATIWRIEGE